MQGARLNLERALPVLQARFVKQHEEWFTCGHYKCKSDLGVGNSILSNLMQIYLYIMSTMFSQSYPNTSDWKWESDINFQYLKK